MSRWMAPLRADAALQVFAGGGARSVMRAAARVGTSFKVRVHGIAPFEVDEDWSLAQASGFAAVSGLMNPPDSGQS